MDELMDSMKKLETYYRMSSEFERLKLAHKLQSFEHLSSMARDLEKLIEQKQYTHENAFQMLRRTIVGMESVFASLDVLEVRERR